VEQLLVNAFGQYGLSGLVICVLFFALYLVFREQRYINEIHADERKQWLQAFKENTEVVRALTGKCIKHQ
jgi:hypothetical protein